MRAVFRVSAKLFQYFRDIVTVVTLQLKLNSIQLTYSSISCMVALTSEGSAETLGTPFGSKLFTSNFLSTYM